jgi:hypothetical protein
MSLEIESHVYYGGSLREADEDCQKDRKKDTGICALLRVRHQKELGVVRGSSNLCIRVTILVLPDRKQGKGKQCGEVERVCEENENLVN